MKRRSASCKLLEVQTGLSKDCQIFEVKIFDKHGVLTKIVPQETLSKKYWKEFYNVEWIDKKTETPNDTFIP